MKMFLLAAGIIAAATITPAVADTWKPISHARVVTLFGVDDPLSQWLGTKRGARADCYRATLEEPIVGPGDVKVVQCYASGYTGASPEIEDFTAAIRN